MLHTVEIRIQAWHVWLANILAIAWFVAITVATVRAIPDGALFRCPIGFCAGGYEADALRLKLGALGPDGRSFIAGTLLQLDMLLPALLLVALLLSTVWFSRPDGTEGFVIDERVRLGLLAVPCLYAIADYAENNAIAEALRLYPSFEDDLARRMSRLTSAKSQLVALAIGIAGGLAVARHVVVRRAL